MSTKPSKPTIPAKMPKIQPVLSREQFAALIHDDPEAALFAYMQVTQDLQRLQAVAAPAAANTPSSAIPPYEKSNTRKRRKARGAREGHTGHGRAAPERIDRTEDHPAPTFCPDCGQPVNPIHGKTACRRRVIIDIPAQIEPEAVAHDLHSAYCTHCQKTVEPRLPDALPGSRLGHRAMSLAASLHYSTNVTLSQLCDIFNAHLSLQITPGGFQHAFHRMAEILTPWYDAIAADVRDSGLLHADETGWRVTGQTHWLWCFTQARSTYYTIDRHRGSAVLTKFFRDSFNGVLISDFWSAYSVVEGLAQQRCLAHLFRELDEVNEEDKSEEWQAFCKKLRRLLRDAWRIKKREPLEDEVDWDERESVRTRLDRRLAQLLEGVDTTHGSKVNPNRKRMVKRLRRHRQALFTFLDFPGIPADNNAAEREIRPAVIARKNSYGNQSDQGAQTQSVFMTVCRTLKKRSLVPMDEINKALRTYSATGILPPLPEPPATIEP